MSVQEQSRRRATCAPAPSWQQFSDLLFRRRLATSFREKAWNRYTLAYRRELFIATWEYFMPLSEARALGLKEERTT